MRRLASVLLAAALVPAPGVDAETPPLRVPDPVWRPLDASRDPGLEAAFADRVGSHPGLGRARRAGRISLGLVDLADPAAPKAALLDGDRMDYAASLPKIGVLYAAHVALEDGSLADGAALRRDLGAMIRVSSNSAATRVIDRLGLRRILRDLQAPEVAFYDRARGGGIWVGRRYGGGGPRIGDPLKGISHAGNARQVCRFYYRLATGRLVNHARSAEMLGHLKDPGVESGFVAALKELAPGATLYRKHGLWRSWYSDSVLVWGEGGRRYVLVAVMNDAGGEALLRALLPLAEEALAAARRGALPRHEAMYRE